MDGSLGERIRYIKNSGYNKKEIANRILKLIPVFIISILAVNLAIYAIVQYIIVANNPSIQHASSSSSVQHQYQLMTSTSWKVTDTSSIKHMGDDEQFQVFTGLIVWATVLLTGFGSEVFVLLLFQQDDNMKWNYKIQWLWLFAQFLFPIMAVITLGLALYQNYLSLLFLYIGLWKFGFPESTTFLYTALYPNKIRPQGGGLTMVVGHQKADNNKNKNFRRNHCHNELQQQQQQEEEEEGRPGGPQPHEQQELMRPSRRISRLLTYDQANSTPRPWDCRLADFLNGTGEALHHASASMVICFLLVGILSPGRHVTGPILFLVLQHFFVLLEPISFWGYTIIELILEVEFERSIISQLEYMIADHWIGGVSGSCMLFSHWIYLSAGGLSLFRQVFLDNNNHGTTKIVAGSREKRTITTTTGSTRKGTIRPAIPVPFSTTPPEKEKEEEIEQQQQQQEPEKCKDMSPKESSFCNEENMERGLSSANNVNMNGNSVTDIITINSCEDSRTESWCLPSYW